MSILIEGKPLYEALGGRDTLKRVHKIFYDKIYAHPWIGQFFAKVSQEIIENQQTDFMTDAMGGPKVYCGRLPIPTHANMFITDELFELRGQLLRESLTEARIPEDLAAHWIKIDRAFRTAVVKKSVADCKRRFPTDEIIAFENPSKAKKVA